MIVSIMDNEKVTRYTLPDIKEKKYLIKYLPSGSNTERDINIESYDEKWYLKSNGSIDVAIDNKIVDKVFLIENAQYTLSVTDENLYSILYCSSSNEEFVKYSLKEINTLTIGNNPSNNIYYANNLVAGVHAKIYLDNNNMWHITKVEEWARVYVNDAIVTDEVLKIGDQIYINGLRVIWMNGFFAINKLTNMKITGINLLVQEEVINSGYEDVTESEENIELYNNKDYFSHVPRLKDNHVFEEIVIDDPPMSEIEADQPFIFAIGGSLMIIASIILMGSNIFNSFSNGKSLISLLPQLIMMGAMIIGIFLLPILSKKYQKKQKIAKEQLRQEKYSNYLKSKEDRINEIKLEKIKIFNENIPNVNGCYDVIANKDRRLWEREITDEDFLTVRLGTGVKQSGIVVNAPRERFSLVEDNLRKRVYEIVENSKELTDVPISFSLIKNFISALICDTNRKDEYVDSLLLQIMTYQAPSDLKIVLFTNKENAERWNYIKFAPHIWSNDKEIRFYADDTEEMKFISSYLEKEYSIRDEEIRNNKLNDTDKSNLYKNFTSSYLIITDDYESAKGLQFINKLLDNDSTNLGFSIFIIDEAMRNIPNKCDLLIEINNEGATAFDTLTSNQYKFNPEYINGINLNECMFKLFNIPIENREVKDMFPKELSLLEMYDVGNIEQLNVLNRWQENDSVISLEAPIGVHPNGDLFKLNLHEKFQGPHGLIAGSTGSGKSELIISYILSMAINYHPDDVQFVLIDYKGGGLAGAFENRELDIKIPHLAGTITNLDTNEMNRTLVSIDSELKRRQEKFNEARDKLSESTIDIYKYQRYYHDGLLTEPISHLFIICDEFAELKSQQPEFMQQLISASRIGRSLGVHLILATQKPSGVVNDQIWSNSRFKICLKVQSRSDSMEMLKRPEAASIKDVGRFYLQVGYDEQFEMGQSAWCGAKYIPTERIKRKHDTSINFVNNTGYIIKNIDNAKKISNKATKGDQLNNIVKYLDELGKKEKYKPRQLWLDRMPDCIYVDSLKSKYHYKNKKYIIDSIIGEYDNPAKQRQGPVMLDLTEKGNAILFGLPTTGKENLLATMVYSMIIDHGLEELNMYLLDFGAETLRVFNNVPHVGDTVFIEDSEKVTKLIDMLNEKIEERKELFADYSGSYKEFCEKSGRIVPSIVVVINAYENFQEKYSRQEDSLYSIIREGNKYGIYFILSTSVNNCIRSRMLQNFNLRFSTQLSDPMDYRTLLNAPKDLIPANNYGRGIAKINDVGFEFQSASIVDKKDMNVFIKVLATKLYSYYFRKAPIIPILPKIVLGDNLAKASSLEKVSIGVNKKDIEEAYYNFSKLPYTTICTNLLDDKLSFVDALLKKISMIPNINLKVIDAYDAYETKVEGINVRSKDLSGLIKEISESLKTEADNNYKTVYFILGIAQLKAKLDASDREIFTNIFDRLKEYKNTYFIGMDSIQAYRSIELDPWFRNNVSIADGIWLGEGFGNQSIIKVNNFTLDDRKVNFPELGVIVSGGKFKFVKFMKNDSMGDIDE